MTLIKIAMRLAIFVVCAVVSVISDAAEIKVVEPSPFSKSLSEPTVVLEGTIEAGDLDKLRRLILDQYGLANEIYLASPGGDVAEAIKIGRFVRSARLGTIVPADLTKPPGFGQTL
jgi:hypothetical protein